MDGMSKTGPNTWPFGKPSERRALEKANVGIVHAAAQIISSAGEAERELEDVIEALRARIVEWEGAYDFLKGTASRAIEGVSKLDSKPNRGGIDCIVREDALNELDELLIACSRATPCDPVDF